MLEAKASFFYVRSIANQPKQINCYELEEVYSHSIVEQSYLRIPEKSGVAFHFNGPLHATLRARSAFALGHQACRSGRRQNQTFALTRIRPAQ